MEPFHYKDHIIITTATFDAFSGKYIPTAAIGWLKADSTRGVHILDNQSLDHFSSCADTQRFALEAAKAWVDEHDAG
jgi:hypothetical protein